MFVNKNGKPDGKGTLDDPANSISKLEGVDAVYLSEGDQHPQLVTDLDGTLHIYPYKRLSSERATVMTKKDLKGKPVIAGLVSSNSLKLFNIKIDGDIDITVAPKTGNVDDPEEPEVQLSHIVLVNCEITGDVNLNGCENVSTVIRDTIITGNVLLYGTKGGIVHLQHSEMNDIVADDNTATKVICGSTQLDRKAKDYGKPVDCCIYNQIKHKDEKQLPETLIVSEHGIGNGTGKSTLK